MRLNLDYQHLESDVREVFSSKKIKEIEVTGTEGDQYFVRIAPCEYAPGLNPGTIISFISLKNLAGLKDQPEKYERVAPYGIVIAHVDKELRYTWIFKPTSGFNPKDVIGKTDIKISPSDGTYDLMAFKKSVFLAESRLCKDTGGNLPLNRGH